MDSGRPYTVSAAFYSELFGMLCLIKKKMAQYLLERFLGQVLNFKGVYSHILFHLCRTLYFLMTLNINILLCIL